MTCANSTKLCTGCGDGYWMDSVANMCKVNCKRGVFTPSYNPNYERESKEPYEAWMPPNNCQACNDGCQYCQNETMSCLDQIISFEVKRDKKDYEFSEMNFLFEFFHPIDGNFLPPTNRDYSHLISLISIEHRGSRRNLQDEEGAGEEGDPAENTALPLLESSLNENGTISSRMVIPETLRQYLEFDIKFTTNGNQFAAVIATEDSYKFSETEISIVAQNPNPQEPPNPFATDEKLKAIQDATAIGA
jgi:hypothetical protein